MLRIVVDLTPVLPGGENGGAKIMAIQLIKQLAALATDYEFTILVTKKSLQELSSLASSNIKIMCVSTPRITFSNAPLFLVSAFLWATYRLTKKILPTFIKARLAHAFHQLRNRLQAAELTKVIKADLLFCPFTAPFYHHLNIPVISVVYDLQSHYYPHFFSAHERYERKIHFKEACRWAKKIICISHFVKETILDKSNLSPDNVKAIHIRLARRLPAIDPLGLAVTLEHYSLTENNFLLFPANFWAHKNHQMLFTAFNIFRAKYPNSQLKLVCTGANNHRKVFLQKSIQRMGLSEWIILPGFLSDEEFGNLISSCRAVIFPSLYEGFGMPALEAMAHGKPILCSNLTSLPEVTGDAAITFDPRKPGEIVDAIKRIEFEPGLINTLIERGNKRLAEFGTAVDMAKEYLDVFRDVAATTQPL